MSRFRTPEELIDAGRVLPDDDESSGDPRPPEFTDEALALRFAEIHSDDLRYCAAWGKWFVYDGKRWRADDTLQHLNLARHVCRAASASCNERKIAAALASAKTVAAVVSLARSDRRLAATIEQWDSNLWELNTPASLIDLRTGTSRPHRAEVYSTKITAAAPAGDCPQWLAFLNRITNGDADLIAFLRRIAGYSLTGMTREHALFFLHGTGANGKSVFINTIAGVFADYHCTSGIETFTATNTDRHPTDLANLRGARLVTAVETEEGRRWAESRIKTLTGEDPISARFMRQDFFTYKPQFKLMIAGNHKPGLRSIDEAIRRRFHLIPFTVTIPKPERDGLLAEKLKAEWPGILQWAIDGCLEWQCIGLASPDAVRKATEEYLTNEDAFAAWCDECCVRTSWELSSALFTSWKAWAERSGEHPGSLKRFREALKNHGFIKVHRDVGSTFEGISLKGMGGVNE